MRVKAILTDIEGTTSSIDFVHNTLFPYAREHLPAFVRAHADEPAVAEQLLAVAAELGEAHLSVEEALAHLLEWIDEDRKLTPLKALQGMLWAQGYAAGDYTGHIYADAADYLRRWQAQGLRLAVYSSGSVQAQQLLFAYSDAGDLSGLFAAFFDTALGGKREQDSYATIAKVMELPSEQVLFLSDIPAELRAAQAAGMQVLGLARHGLPMSVEAAAFEWCRSFADVDSVLSTAS